MALVTMEFFSPHSLIVLFLSIFLYRFFFTTLPKKLNNNKGFKNYPILGVLPEFLKNQHRFLDWTTEVLTLSPTMTATYVRFGNGRGVVTANPLNVEYMLKTNFQNYPKGDQLTSMGKDFLGDGIFNADSEVWKVQRKTASYEFNTKSLQKFVMDHVKFEVSTRLVPILEKASKTNQVLDLQDILQRFAFDNICKLAFNVDPGCLGGDATTGAEFMRAFDDAATYTSGRFLYTFLFMWKVKRFFNIGSERQLKKSINIVHEFANNIIRSRMADQKGEKRDEDLLSRFIGNNENSFGFLKDIAISIILAGRDTTSSALTSFFWLLSSHPEVERKILKELKTVRERHGKSKYEVYGYNELRDMHYLHAAISETLRLYPPVYVDSKVSLNDDILPDGTFVGKGWVVTYHTYGMARMESLWGKNCREFEPERWLENGVCKQENPFKFPVFHAGPRMCLGKDMAYLQMKSIAAAVIERFEVEVQDKCREQLVSLTLRMKGGLPVKLKERITCNLHGN